MTSPSPWTEHGPTPSPRPQGATIFKPPQRDLSIASFGKVLANRTTLYKYLNPHLVGVVSAAPPSLGRSGDASSRCALHLLDGVTGGPVYQVDIPVEPDAECSVQATITENWLVYHYWEHDINQPHAGGGAKGWRAVSVEFYEGTGVDQRFKSSEQSSYSLASIPISVYEQSFVFPRGITALTTTSTANGISVKDLLVATETNQIQSFPRRLLDPRRPIGTKPSALEQEHEWLIQYDPLLPDDPKRMISHRYDAYSIQKIHTSPTRLESTCLIFAHGVDLFFSRTSPSGTFDLLSEGFNKPQLILTIAALSIGVLITRPMVRRKKLKEKWYF